jgi:hypothetical protein
VLGGPVIDRSVVDVNITLDAAAIRLLHIKDVRDDPCQRSLHVWDIRPDKVRSTLATASNA